ncbi:hypothetical protein EZ313_02325 [Ramlibacter henchirensis]|uniref:DUF1127 domain-containing protein n=1 Tax=Ramlibacter henchirensis TaxID=204072 RepID=A0A4Z0C507_9BURK|nr:hypothetical protein [Ramlibacter henchirensis]TFZ05530.1 hypothetical protein EZ313_02325 [Ramlibacter henchirensis]
MLSQIFTKARDALRFARARREFTRLDAQTYRDLGITPSEFDSYWAESQGLTEPTRRRVRSLRPAA